MQLCAAKWSRRHWRSVIVTRQSMLNARPGKHCQLCGVVANKLKSWMIVFINCKLCYEMNHFFDFFDWILGLFCWEQEKLIWFADKLNAFFIVLSYFRLSFHHELSFLMYIVKIIPHAIFIVAFLFHSPLCLCILFCFLEFLI